ALRQSTRDSRRKRNHQTHGGRNSRQARHVGNNLEIARRSLCDERLAYADEPLQKKQLKRQSEAQRLNASAGDPRHKKEITLSMTRPSRTNEGKGRKKPK